MWNTRYLRANKLPEPREWVDLTRPVYFGHVSTSSPSRSGTTHLTVETILQGEGWDKGWSQILQMSGNSAAITERSFGVPDGVSNGQFGIGIVIDFFGLAAKNSGFPVEFVYPSMTSIVPANIGLIAGAKEAEMARNCCSIPRSAVFRCCPRPTARRPRAILIPMAGRSRPR
jgi:ABC-type Fe3+ transport system substrate-binding protein